MKPEQIDALLPQTQCGLCGYKGCMPYAQAIAFNNAPIHLCPPGGLKTLQALGELLQQDYRPYLSEMTEKAKPPLVANIREPECIGCTKCIQACPVDAIIGAAKQMHSILSDVCTGCELCIPPCPVDCIDMLAITPPSERVAEEKANQSRQRFIARETRLAREKHETKSELSIRNRKAYITDAIKRAKNRKQFMNNKNNE